MRSKYVPPKLSERLIKVNYFLSVSGFLDDFNLMGDVYAQSNPTNTSSNTTTSGNTSTATSSGGSGGCGGGSSGGTSGCATGGGSSGF